MTDALPPYISQIADRLRGELPGHDAFRELSGYQRPDMEAVLRMEPPPRRSAVLVLLYGIGPDWHTLLMLRPTYDGVHSGQVAFPGGHSEPGDRDAHHTALREFTEETGVVDPGIRVLGRLTPVYIPPSHALVTPVVGYAPVLSEPDPDPREVAALIPVPLSHLLRDDILKRTNVYVSILGREIDVPYWDVDGHVVWGATALMIAELRDVIRSAR